MPDHAVPCDGTKDGDPCTAPGRWIHPNDRVTCMDHRGDKARVMQPTELVLAVLRALHPEHPRIHHKKLETVLDRQGLKPLDILSSIKTLYLQGRIYPPRSGYWALTETPDVTA